MTFQPFDLVEDNEGDRGVVTRVEDGYVFLKWDWGRPVLEAGPFRPDQLTNLSEIVHKLDAERVAAAAKPEWAPATAPYDPDKDVF